MNHPSDYMPQYREQSSSDQSEHNISLQMRPAPQSRSNKKNTSTSFMHPRPTQPKRHKKPPKAVSVKLPVQPPKPKIKRSKPSQTDYLVLGNQYFSCKSIEQVSQRLVKKQPDMIMKLHRLKKKEKRCVGKIQIYLRTFLQNIKNKPLISLKQKIELYKILKEERGVKIEVEDAAMEKLMRKVLLVLQKNSEKLIAEYPSQKSVINQWKSYKMHQLMTAQSFLFQKNHLQRDVLDLEKELDFLAEKQFFPELKQDVKELERQIRIHLSCGSDNAKPEGGDQGVKWVLDKLISYIQEKDEFREEVLRKLTEYSAGYIFEPLLDDSLYVCFQRDEIGMAENEEESIEKSYMHIFNKAVFDLVNETVSGSEAFQPTLEGVKGLVGAAWGALLAEDWQIWREDMFLWVEELIYQQLLDDFLQDFIDFY